MSFIAPLMLLGLLAIGVPIWIHLFGSRRAKRVEFAAIDFLLGTDRRVARSLRMRELLLLAARIGVYLAIPLLLAKPFVSCEARGPSVTRGPQGAVLVIDNGASSGYRDDDGPLLEEAQSRARAVLDGLGPEADVAIVFTAAGAVPDQLSRDHVRLRDRIGSAEPSAAVGDVIGALERAAQLLGGSQHERNTIFLFSPLTRAAFASTRAPWPPGKGPALTVIDVAEDKELDNVAVVSLEVQADPSSGPRGIRVTAEIRNFGRKPSGEREARLSIGGEVLARSRFTVGPGDAVMERFTASLDQGQRTAEVEVTIDGDALAVDDHRRVVTQLREQVRVLLVNGDPRTVRYEDELFYVETALSHDAAAVSATEITADGLDDTDLGSLDVIVLANVAALSPERVQAIRKFVAAGGGLFIAVGDNVVPEDYNSAMGSLLPQELASVFDAGYGSRGAERDLKALRLAKLDADHPVLELFGTQGVGLRDAAFSKVVLLGPTTKVSSRRVLARYASGAAALLEGTIGSGRVLLLTSSLDRDWSDLAIQTGFLPLIDQSMRYLAKKQLSAGAGDVLVGQAAQVSVLTSDRRLEIKTPNGESTVFEGDRLAGREAVRFAGTTAPGFYSVAAVGKGGKRIVRPESAFAVNPDPAISSLERIAKDDLPVGGTGQGELAASPHRKVELWHAIGAVLLLLLLFEGLLVVRN